MGENCLVNVQRDCNLENKKAKIAMGRILRWGISESVNICCDHTLYIWYIGAISKININTDHRYKYKVNPNRSREIKIL